MTRSIISLASSESPKRNQRIRIEPIPDDLHARLTRYSQAHRYSRLMDALFYAATIGLSVLEASEGVAIIKVNNSLQS